MKEARTAGKVVFGGNRLSGGLFDKDVYVESVFVTDLPPEHARVRRLVSRRWSEARDPCIDAWQNDAT